MPPRSTPDYTAEIAEALHASDAQRLARIAMELLVIAGTALERRERDRQRKQDARSCPRKSTESAEIHGQNGQRSSSSVLESTSNGKDYYASAEIHGQPGPDEAVMQRMDMLRGQVGDADFPSVDAFVRRRPYRTWLAWLDEMLTSIGPGSQYMPVDLVRVCRDDGALDRPIGSPRGLRSFLHGARVERVREREGLPALPKTRTDRALSALDGL